MSNVSKNLNAVREKIRAACLKRSAVSTDDFLFVRLVYHVFNRKHLNIKLLEKFVLFFG